MQCACTTERFSSIEINVRLCVTALNLLSRAHLHQQELQAPGTKLNSNKNLTLHLCLIIPSKFQKDNPANIYLRTLECSKAVSKPLGGRGTLTILTLPWNSELARLIHHLHHNNITLKICTRSQSWTIPIPAAFKYLYVFFRWTPFRRSAYLTKRTAPLQPEDKKFFGALLKPKVQSTQC